MFTIALFIIDESGNNSMSIDWQIVKQNAVYIFNGILVSLTKE